MGVFLPQILLLDGKQIEVTLLRRLTKYKVALES